MLCLWQPTFNHMRRSLDGFTSRLAPIRAAVRATTPKRTFGCDPRLPESGHVFMGPGTADQGT